MKLGTIDSVLDGKGKDVSNCEDLYCTEKDNGLFVPTVIGVAQTYKEYAESCWATIFEEITQKEVLKTYGKKDRTNADVIALIFNPEIFTKSMLRDFVSAKDIMGRIKLVDYEEKLDFSIKNEINYKRTFELLKNIDSSDLEDANSALSKEFEKINTYLGWDQELYGLTRIEALAKNALKELTSRYDGPSKISRASADALDENGKISGLLGLL